MAELTPIEAIQEGSAVSVRFDDGIIVTFLPYTHGLGYQIEGLRQFFIKDKHGKVVVQYDARLYRCGPQPDEHKLTKIENGWTIARIVAYWEAAKKYCSALFWNGEVGGNKTTEKWWYHWVVTKEGRIDLDSLKDLMNESKGDEKAE